MKSTFYQLFREQALRTPQKTALIIDGREYSYIELLKRTDFLAERLEILFQEGKKHIATFLDNSVEMVLLLLGASKTGVTLVPLPPDLPYEFAYEILKACDVDIAVGQEKRDFKDVENLTVKNLWEMPNRKNGKNIKPDLDTPFIITTTSGSTGKPKPIVLTQRIKLRRAFKGAKEVFNLSEDDVYIVSTPLYHSLAQRFTLLPLATGATAIVMKKFNLHGWLERAQKYKGSFGVLVSSQLENIVSYLMENQRSYELRSIKKLISSSAPLLEKTRKKALELSKIFNWEIYETYGTSEIGFASVLNMTKETSKWDSVGKPLPYVDIKILSEEGETLPPNQIGEIAVRTETAFAGYYKMPEKTKESFTEDAYFLTGDLGYIDGDGYLYFSGRKKDVIITGGINVFPQDVEKVILSYSKVKECVVFGVENDYFGEVVCALVVPSEPVTEKELRTFLRGKLTSYQMPIYIDFVEQIPRNYLGKVVRKDLKKLVNIDKLNSTIEKIKHLTI